MTLSASARMTTASARQCGSQNPILVPHPGHQFRAAEFLDGAAHMNGGKPQHIAQPLLADGKSKLHPRATRRQISHVKCARCAREDRRFRFAIQVG